MFYLVCERSRTEKEFFEYISIFNENCVRHIPGRGTTIVHYDDIHNFLVTHKKELFRASIVINESLLNEEVLDFLVSKLKLYTVECHMYVEFRLNLNVITYKSQVSHVYDFIEKMKNRDLIPMYFHISTCNEVYTVGYEPYN